MRTKTSNPTRAALLICLMAATLLMMPTIAAAEPTVEQAKEALRSSVAFFRGEVASHRGYVWEYAEDLSSRRGEARVDEHTIWVQPPGTPTVGLAFLDAYEATGERRYLQAARDAAVALVRGQLHSGGWDYHIDFRPDRREHAYRIPPAAPQPDVRIDPDEPGGLEIWSQRRYANNKSMLDDDTTQAALRLLMRVDQALDFNNDTIHEAVGYGLAALLKVQYPVGAWSHNYDRFPPRNPDENYYPVLDATYPEDWPREWPKAFAGCYMLNDRITLDAIETLLLASEIYERPVLRKSALLGADFLLRAQMPAPQPAWAQQYDRRMQPVWDRAFEPPAISGGESQEAMRTLMRVYRATGERKYLDAVESALEYLEKKAGDDDTLARFYELETDRPLYFTQDYELTYDDSNPPDHYSFTVNSDLPGIRAEFEQLAEFGPDAPESPPTADELVDRANRAIETLDSRGRWIEDGLIRSATFAENLSTLAAFIQQAESRGE